MSKIRIAHMAGPTATIQNTPPLVTSNKARLRKGLPPMTAGRGNAAAYDPLRAQRLAAPVKVYVEQFSAHPLEADAAELYDEPDGYLAADGSFSKGRKSEADKPVYEIELKPEDGLYPLPYMAMQADGSPWEEETTKPLGTVYRQGFYPDGSRSFLITNTHRNAGNAPTRKSACQGFRSNGSSWRAANAPIPMPMNPAETLPHVESDWSSPSAGARARSTTVSATNATARPNTPPTPKPVIKR